MQIKITPTENKELVMKDYIKLAKERGVSEEDFNNHFTLLHLESLAKNGCLFYNNTFEDN